MRRGMQKFGARRTQCKANHFHPSCGEATRCDWLHAMQSSGAIFDLKAQASVTIVPGFKYKPDFTYTEMKDGERVLIVEDFKGVVTQRFRDIKRMWPHHGQGALRVSRLQGQKFYIEKDIQGSRR